MHFNRFLLCVLALLLSAGVRTDSVIAQSQRKQPVLPKDTLPKQLPLEHVPSGLNATRSIPADNRLTAARVVLGRSLFFDPVLSANNTVACASCHQPQHGFAAPDARAIGIHGQVGLRNAPSLLNRAYGTRFFWDGRAGSLEEQALKDLRNSWRPFDDGAFQGLDRERTTADRLRRQVALGVQELLERYGLSGQDTGS